MISATTPELEDKLLATQERVAELRVNLKNLLSGGCALEALLDAAILERDAIEVELRRRAG